MIFFEAYSGAWSPGVILWDRPALEGLLKKHSIQYADIDRMLAEPRLAFQPGVFPFTISPAMPCKTISPRLKTSDGAVLLTGSWLIGQRAYRTGSAAGHRSCRCRSTQWTWPHTGGKPP